jgi:hypothetical protein
MLLEITRSYSGTAALRIEGVSGRALGPWIQIPNVATLSVVKLM